MLVILSPAKTINMSPGRFPNTFSKPEFLSDATLLIEQLRGYTPSELQKLMKVSEKLAILNFERFAAWKSIHSQKESNQAIISFSGEVFNGLDARTLNQDDLDFAQDHLRILSGLYGVLRPLDLIMPYRLEMGSKLKNVRGKNLYEFWREIIPRVIEGMTAESKTLINLASDEYFKSIKPENFPHRIITPVFMEQNGDSFRMVTIYAKKARGMMLRYVLQNKIIQAEYLKGFEDGGYLFNQQLSTADKWVFCR